MSRKSSSEDVSSLDMLLDTMCNTFGGIVFIALLLSIISGTAARQSHENDQLSSVESANNDIIIIEKALRDQIASYQHAIEATTSVDPDESSVDIARINNDAMLIVGAESNMLHDIILVQREVDRTTQMINEIAVKLGDITSQMLESREQIEIAKKKSTQTLRMPKVYTAYGKRNIFVAVSDGKFYAINKIPDAKSNYMLDGYDLEDVDVESGEGKDVIELRPTSGQVVTVATTSSGKIVKALNNYNPERDVICFVVKRNSFGEFNILKKKFIEKGFSYNWYIDHDPIEIVTSSTSPEAQ